MAKKTVQSVEPNVADLCNGWMKSYGLDYRLEQQSLNTEIDKALDDYYSKNGGVGGFGFFVGFYFFGPFGAELVMDRIHKQPYG